MNRRKFIERTAFTGVAPFMGSSLLLAKDEIRITEVRCYEVNVNQRGSWYFIELFTDKGLSGLGECSHAHPPTDPSGRAKVSDAVRKIFQLLKGQSIYSVNYLKTQVIQPQDKLHRTVCAAFEQCLWDLIGKANDLPIYTLFGGKLHDKLAVYANINRATNERDAKGRRLVDAFVKTAEKAVSEGFEAFKLAPFDEMKPLSEAHQEDISETLAYVIACIAAVRNVIGTDKKLLVDVHSHLDKALTKQFAEQSAEYDLYWIEEPMEPSLAMADLAELRQEIKPILAGGESIFGLEGFMPIFSHQSLDTVMPDVKHCGGIQSLYQISSMAAALGVSVAPHNPSGPIATAATLMVCATMPNFQLLEFAYGEVPWRAQLILPHENFKDGHLQVSERPGLGVTWNRTALSKHLV